MNLRDYGAKQWNALEQFHGRLVNQKYSGHLKENMSGLWEREKKQETRHVGPVHTSDGRQRFVTFVALPCGMSIAVDIYCTRVLRVLAHPLHLVSRFFSLPKAQTSSFSSALNTFA